MNISDIFRKYRDKLDYLDLELLLAHSLGQTREFVLIHPEYIIFKKQEAIIKKFIQRRITGEPIAYITGHKEFFGLDFIVNKHTLVPRPETELIVDLALNDLQQTTYNIQQNLIIDIGTGSGNIIISLAKSINSCKSSVFGCKFLGIDISKGALAVAKKNAKNHGVDKKIKFLHGDLLSKLDNVVMKQCDSLVVLANLPYLSKEIYKSAPRDVKNFEPKSALYSPEKGFSHYKKLLQQLKKIVVSCKLPASRRQATTSRGGSVVCYFEISPEQKQLLTLLVKKTLPEARIKFHKDLAGKWRVCEIKA